MQKCLGKFMITHQFNVKKFYFRPRTIGWKFVFCLNYKSWLCLKQSRETDCKSARTRSDAVRFLSESLGIVFGRNRSAPSAGRSVVNRIRRVTCTQDTLPVLYNNLRLRLYAVIQAIGLTSVNRRGTVSQLPTDEIGTVREPPSSAAGVAERWPRGPIEFTRICNRFPNFSLKLRSQKTRS